MSLFGGGWWRILVLVVGSILLVAIGFFAAMIVTGGGAPPGGAAVASTSGEGAGGEKPADQKEIESDKKKIGKTLSKEGGKEGKAAAKVLSFVPGSAFGLLNSRSTTIGNKAAEKTAEGVGEVATPGIKVASSAVQGVLPPFLARQVPWVASYAEYESKAQTRAAVEHATDAQVEAVKSLREGGGEAGGEAEGEAATTEAASAGGGAAAGGEAQPASTAGEAAAPQIEQSAGAARATAPTSIWTVELGRFATLHNAEEFAGDISRQGFGAHVFVDNIDNRYWYSVRAGSFATSGDADIGLDRMRKVGLDGTVVSELRGGR